MKTITPIVLVAGATQWPRFYIGAIEGCAPPQMFWNAENPGWVRHRKNATLYEILYEATALCRQLQLDQFLGKPVRKFTVPVTIELLSDGPVEEAALRDWLRKAVNFTIAIGNYGIGPVENSLVFAEIEWDKFKANSTTEKST